MDVRAFWGEVTHWRWMRAWPWLLALALLGLARGASADRLREAGVRFEPRPSWVTPLDWSGVAAPEASGGVAVLVMQYELRYEGGQSVAYYRRVARVVSEAGARVAGEQRINFTPPHEHLLLHAIQLRRGSQVIQALAPEELQILQRETGMDIGVYSGERTVLALLRDVRVGDEVDCEYSVSGNNPVFAGHLALHWQLRFPWGVGLLQYRALSDRPLSLRALGGATPPEPRRMGALSEYLFQSSKVKALPLEESLPPEYELFPRVQLGDMATWHEVSDWGHRLFQRASPSAAVRQVAREVTADAATAEARTIAALHFVQESVRYTSLAFAQSSHRPAEPELVLKRRFGDCKDKSLLLVTMLQALGIDAQVALVSTRGGARLSNVLPAIPAFDHAIVALELDGRRYYVDPTRTYQRGSLAEHAVQPFGRALLLGSVSDALAEVPEPNDPRPQIHAAMRYDIARIGAPVKLLTTLTLRGNQAERVRALRATNTSEEFDKLLAAAVTATHADAKLIGNSGVTDSVLDNQIVVQQFFALEQPWHTGADGRKRLPFFPPWFRNALPSPPAGRVHPLSIDHPLRVTHAIEVHCPELHGTLANSDSVGMLAYKVELAERLDSQKLTLDYDFRTLASRIEPEQFPAYREAVSTVSKMLDVGFVEPAPLVAANKLWFWISALVSALALLACLIVVQLRQPYLKRRNVPRNPALARRAGWLALLGLGVTISPLRNIATTVEVLRMMEPRLWTAMTAPGSAGYHPWYAALASFEIISCVVLIALSTYCAFLYWTTSRSFPLLFVVSAVISLVVSVADQVLSSLLSQDHQGAAMTVFGWCVLLAWIAYVLGSSRVASLFVPDPDMRPFYDPAVFDAPDAPEPNEPAATE